MINQSISLNPKLEQQLKLSPMAIQRLEILQLSQLELLEYIDSEIEQNPLLESEPSSSLSAEELSSYFESLKTTKSGSIKDPEIYETPISYRPTLLEHLTEQLSLLDIPIDQLKTCKLLLGNLDERGYLCETLENISTQFKIPIGLLESSLETLQSLEPRGIGARSLSECLLLQLDEDSDFDTLRIIISEHLEHVALNKITFLSQKLKLSVAELEVAIEKLRSLDPKPGLKYDSSSYSDTEYIVPDITVQLEDGVLVVKSQDAFMPKLFLNESYTALLASDSDPKSRDYLTEKLNRAIFVLRSIEQRKQTLLSVVESIVFFQEGFFLGKSGLKPLNMKDVANALDIHESTVSRAIRGKYISSPLGIHPIKFFFSNKVSLDSDFSSSELKSRLASIVDHEDKSNPYSDQKISEIMLSEGISIARRTVAKYREELGIKPSSLRKIHT